MIYNTFQLVSEAIDNPKNKDSKAIKAIKRATLVGGTIAAGHGVYKGKKEYDNMRTVFINIQNELMDKHGYEGLHQWKLFKQTPQYKKLRNKATLNVIKHGAISGAVAFLLYGFYAWMKHHKIEKDLPKQSSI